MTRGTKRLLWISAGALGVSYIVARWAVYGRAQASVPGKLIRLEDVPPGAIVHQVRHGETLPSIATHYYGDKMLWPLVYDVNTNRIPAASFEALRRNPGSLIFEPSWDGTMLLIPEVESAAQYADAKRRALG